MSEQTGREKMLGKVVRKSKAGNMLEIAVNDTKDWYWLTTQVQGFAKTGINEGDEVEFTAGDGQEGVTIYYISKKGGTPVHTGPTGGFERKSYGKSPEEQDSIKRQAVLKASADAVATTMAGRIDDMSVLGDMIIALYNKLYPVVQ